MSLSQKNWFFVFGIIGFVLLAYSNVYSFSFLYDDEFFIVKNEFLDSFRNFGNIFTHSLTGGSGYSDSFYRPLQAVIYLITNQIFGRETWAFHFLNIFFHSLNAVLIFVLASRFRLSRGASFFAASLWGLHPIHTECVTYMSGTADSLHTLFMLLALVVVAPSFKWRQMVIAFVLFICALMSKEAAIAFPAILVSIIFFFDPNRWSIKPYFKTLPFWLMAGIYLFLRKGVLNFNQDFSFFKVENIYTQNILYRAYTFLATLPGYLKILFWPQGLHIDREFLVYTEFTYLPVILGIGICALAISALVLSYLYRPKYVWPAWMVLWFAAAYAPHTGVLVPMNSLFLEHWMYSPSIGLFMGVGAFTDVLWRSFPKSKALISSILLGCCVLLGALTFQQNTVWENPMTLYTHILKYNPKVARVRHNLAMYYSELGNFPQALEQYEITLKTNDTYPQTYHNMGHIYLQQRKLDLAEEYFLKALEKSPQFFPSLGELAKLYEIKGETIKAQEYSKRYREARGL